MTGGTGGVMSTSAELASLGIRVTPDNVLQLRNALAAEVDRLTHDFQVARWAAPVGECGGDPLSRPAAEAFNRKIQAFRDQNDAYVRELAAARDILQHNALAYGHSEDDIAKSFDAFKATLPAMYEQVRQELIRQAPDRVRDLIAPPPPAQGQPLPGMFGGRS